MNISFLKKLQNKFLIVLVLSTIIPVAIIGWYGIYSSTKALTDSALNQISYVLTYNAEKIGNFLDSLDKDVLFLSKTPPVQMIINAKNNNKIDDTNKVAYKTAVNQLNTIFLEMIKVKPYYMQLRYLDENGNEIVRVDSNGVQGKVISPSELQNKAKSDYFIQTMQLKTGEVYVSPINLNRERGKIEVPYKPVIRYSTPIYGRDGKKRGIVIANVFAQAFIEPLKQIKPYEGSKLFLVNKDGYYLYHPDETKEWGFEFNHNKIQKNYPVDLANKIFSNERGYINEGLSNIIGYRKIVYSQKYKMILICESPKSVVFASINSFKAIAGIIIIICMLIILAVEFFIVNKLISLIRDLVNGISSFSTQIVSTIEEQERLTSQQASSVNQTTTTMDELNASSQKSAEQAEEAVTAAQQALILVDADMQSGQSLSLGTTSFKEKVRQISEQINQLSEHTKQITNITNLINDLANQTNMLSLNAAVEAARAGSNGKGFAVIASEIRKLADQSQKSLEKINGIVNNIENATKQTAIVTKEGSQSVEDIVMTINNIVVNNQQISMTAKQQAIAIQQVVEAMNKLNTAAKETAGGISQTKIGTQKLNESALKLKAVVR
ncbi:MAG TPA: methyl-accepting chemotaxis protein [Candidatus Obscuribacterales bacterium]